MCVDAFFAPAVLVSSPAPSTCALPYEASYNIAKVDVRNICAFLLVVYTEEDKTLFLPFQHCVIFLWIANGCLFLAVLLPATLVRIKRPEKRKMMLYTGPILICNKTWIWSQAKFVYTFTNFIISPAKKKNICTRLKNTLDFLDGPCFKRLDYNGERR